MNKNVENSNVPLFMKLLSVVLVGIIALVIWQVTRANQVEQTPPPTTNATTPATTADEKKATTTDVKTGIVKGTAIYPSEGYPADFKVCVLNESTKAEIVCDSAMAGKTGMQTYEMTVTPGKYLVAAKTGDMTGYYDEYMKNESYNGSNATVCDANYYTPIVIEVVAGNTLDGITAGDFYYEQENC
jgi:hypothetical protein